ncbi:MAG: hypothetical protein J6V70_05120 [Kiritimatiellae bacterium]|nr:hypothetical protein [Kiritimatiellia bacterium]
MNGANLQKTLALSNWNHEMHEGTGKRFLWFNSLGESDLLEDNNPCGCGIML